MIKNEDLLMLDGIGQAELIRRKEISSTEIVELSISRISEINPIINAVVQEMYEHARELSLNPEEGTIFSGVPFLIKDFLAEYAGFRFNAGSKFLEGYISEEDTELVRRYKRSGLVTLGKTNSPEFAIGCTTEPLLNGPTRNPWDINLTTGGSSGGAAAAVSSGLVPLAHGNDAGGSIRIPASCCGVFGLKPTRGRNPLGPGLGDAIGGLVAEHALTRSVRDSAALLDSTAGPSFGDPYFTALPERPFLQEIGVDPGQLRIGFSSDMPRGGKAHPDCVEAVERVAYLCQDLGHDVEEVSPKFNANVMFEAFSKMMASGVAWMIRDWERKINKKAVENLFEPNIWGLLQAGSKITSPEYLLAVQDIQNGSREVAEFFNKYDFWLTPTLGKPPVPLGTFIYEGDPFDLRRRLAEFVPFTWISNLTGQPGMSVPLHWNGDGLPIGVHFTGKFGDEATMFRIASQLEVALPWANRIPIMRE